MDSSSSSTITENTTPTPFNGKITFYFQNIEVRTLLQLIAKTSGLNFIISDAVKGNTTLNLKNVTWSQALAIIKTSNGLASERTGNTIFISTEEELNKAKTKLLKDAQDLASLTPLSSAIITLRYTDSNNMAKLLKGEHGNLLTARGEVAVDARTNSLIIRDIKTNLSDLVHYIHQLDIPAKQVSIEARIVTLDSTYEAQLGVQFGISNTRSLSGSLAGANQLAQGVAASNISPLTERLNFALPASALSTGPAPASIGLALARLGPVLLDLELSALEEEGHSQIISKPRVVTANQQKAIIQTGQEIPYQQATSSGATSVEFKKALLSLEILPQITPDDKILLKLRATQDTVGTPLVTAQQVVTAGTTDTVPVAFGPPTINTQAVESFVLLNNNETVVIGGIYQLNKQNTLDRVPFLSKLPIIGNLFKHRSVKNGKTELLIFITPKIIKSHGTLAYNDEHR
jgi:type IV pilus assembly protein PilQ